MKGSYLQKSEYINSKWLLMTTCIFEYETNVPEIPAGVGEERLGLVRDGDIIPTPLVDHFTLGVNSWAKCYRTFLSAIY
jgi:hypothetical protein